MRRAACAEDVDEVGEVGDGRDEREGCGDVVIVFLGGSWVDAE